MLAPLVAVIVALALWPGLILERGQSSVTEKVDAVAARGVTRQARRTTGRGTATLMDFNAPDIDYAGLSPIIALTGGLGADPARRAARRQPRGASVVVVSVVGFGTLAAAAGLLIAQWGAHKNLVAGALRLDDLALAASLSAIAAAAFCIPLSWREQAFDRPLGPERARRVPGAADLLGARDDDARPGAEPDRLLRRDRAAVDPALRALRRGAAPRAARSSRGSST